MADQKTNGETSFPLHKIKVLLLESIAQSAVDNFVTEGYSVETAHRLTPEELKERIKDVHAIGIRSKTHLTKEVLDCAKKLLVIGHFCIGTDQTNIEYAATKGFPVFNSPFANTRSVAELVIAEMIMLARQAGDRSRELHAKTWNKVSKGCFEVRGKTLGIVGYGHVGQQLSVLSEALGLKVLYYDIVPQLSLGNARPAESLEELLQTSDFVSLHVPKTPETRNMISEKQVKLMKKGSYLINAARGTCAVLKPVADALKSGHLAGAAFDVYPEEAGAKTNNYENELQGCPNTILTPHIGGSTEEAQIQIGTEVSNKLINFINSGSTHGTVNFPVVDLPPLAEEVHRIVNIHQSRPGVLRKINNILAETNILGQSLSTRKDIGYLMVDLDKAVSEDVKNQIKSLDECIRTRVIW